MSCWQNVKSTGDAPASMHVLHVIFSENIPAYGIQQPITETMASLLKCMTATYRPLHPAAPHRKIYLPHTMFHGTGSAMSHFQTLDRSLFLL